MTTELKQAAQDAAEAIDWLLNNIRRDAPQLSGKAMGNAEKCASALRTALAQQPATPEPVLFIHPDTFAMNNAQVGAWRPGYELTSYIPLYTHPAPSVPAAVVRDAERYRWLKQGCSDKGTKASHIAENLYGFEWDEAIDAAMLAANEGGK